VVIPAYNCEAYVREAIDSVLAQTFADFELIVVDDGSTDSTPEILHMYEQLQKARIVTHETNRGLSAARNSGIRSARGRYVTFLDADDIWRPEKLEYHLSILSKDPTLMFVSNNGLWFQDGEEVVFPPLPETPALREVGWKTLLLGGSPFSASNATIRRECFEDVGMFDERLRAAEDRDLWIRIARRYGTTQASGTVSGYRRHPGNMSADPVHMKRNMQIVLAKACRASHCPLALRARAYAHLYLDVAIVSYEARRRLLAAVLLCKSCLVWPLPLGREVRKHRMVRWIWAVKIALGRDAFEWLWHFIKGLWKNARAPHTSVDIAQALRKDTDPLGCPEGRQKWKGGR